MHQYAQVLCQPGFARGALAVYQGGVAYLYKGLYQPPVGLGRCYAARYRHLWSTCPPVLKDCYGDLFYHLVPVHLRVPVLKSLGELLAVGRGGQYDPPLLNVTSGVGALGLYPYLPPQLMVTVLLESGNICLDEQLGPLKFVYASSPLHSEVVVTLGGRFVVAGHSFPLSLLVS